MGQESALSVPHFEFWKNKGLAYPGLGKYEEPTFQILDISSYDVDSLSRYRSLSTAVLNAVIRLSADKKRYEDISVLISKYERERVEAKYAENQQVLKRESKVISEISTTQESLTTLEKEISSKAKELSEKEVSLEENKDAIEILKGLETDKQKLEFNISEDKQLLASNRSELAGVKTSLEALTEEIAKKEAFYIKRQVLEQIQNWLNECFVPAICDMEQNVLESINQQFNQLFQRWFSMLIETGDISVEVDENITPIITQSGYSLDFDSLSGGEKTSVALAYRLALNIMIKNVASMQNSLLILDEPTDGFSKEQLIRLREVLDELNTAKVIMVSHDKELESFVDKIYRITKLGNISKVELLKT